MCVEHLIFLDLKHLKKRGYLKNSAQGIESWNDGSNITVMSDLVNQQIYVSYKYDGKPFAYKVSLIKFYIELTDSYRYYLECPVSHKRATMLYMYHGQFMHLSELYKRGVYYHNQKESKRNREIDAHHRNKKKVAKFKANKKAKRFYNGKLTKRFERMERIEERSIMQMQNFLGSCTWINKFIR